MTLIGFFENFGIIKIFIFENFGIIQQQIFENFGIIYSFSFGNRDFISTFAPNKIRKTMAERIFRRKIYEQMLSWNKLYYHTWPTPSGKHNYEIDFLLSRNAKICPIEVKSSRSNLHVSIDEFQKKFSARILKRYLLHSKDIRKEQDLILLPMYMSLFL